MRDARDQSQLGPEIREGQSAAWAFAGELSCRNPLFWNADCAFSRQELALVGCVWKGRATGWGGARAGKPELR
ncbi:MAG TPA: hypothetical protein DC058_15460 [Planctomycetaceae bacterium]|nr:hypothetical protein [Planctomycetaceae bacterium]